MPLGRGWLTPLVDDTGGGTDGSPIDKDLLTDFADDIDATTSSITTSWTPVLTFATPGNQVIVLSSQVGRYTKVGRFFHASFYLVTSTFTHSTASGSLTITGFPLTPDGNVEHHGTLSFAGITKANYTQFIPRFNGGTSTIDIIASGSGQARSAVAAADVPTSGSVILIGQIDGFV